MCLSNVDVMSVQSNGVKCLQGCPFCSLEKDLDSLCTEQALKIRTSQKFLRTTDQKHQTRQHLKCRNNNWSLLFESKINDTYKFLKRSYSPFRSRHCGHNPEQPMLEGLQLEKSSRRHIWPSKDWSHYGTGETMRNPWTRRTFHCCCFHHSPLLPLLPSNALCDKEPKMEQTKSLTSFSYTASYSFSLHCLRDRVKITIGYLRTVHLRIKAKIGSPLYTSKISWPRCAWACKLLSLLFISSIHETKATWSAAGLHLRNYASILLNLDKYFIIYIWPKKKQWEHNWSV